MDNPKRKNRHDTDVKTNDKSCWYDIAILLYKRLRRLFLPKNNTNLEQPNFIAST